VIALFVVSVVVLAVAGIVAYTVFRSRSSGSLDDANTSPAGGVKAGGLGPQPGDDLATYTRERALALAAAKGVRVAIVSFPKYLTEAQARAAAGPLPVIALLAAVPGRAPSVVMGPFADWVKAQVADQRSERDEIQKLLPTVDDAQFKAFYRQEIDRLGKLIDSVKPDGPLVFGAVVRGQAATLQGQVRSPAVRLVDVAPAADVKPGTPERGVRPEETVKANDPPVRPA